MRLLYTAAILNVNAQKGAGVSHIEVLCDFLQDQWGRAQII